MPDYKEMYLKMMRATEEAMGVLIAAQRECEELFISAPGPFPEDAETQKNV